MQIIDEKVEFLTFFSTKEDYVWDLVVSCGYFCVVLFFFPAEP